MNPLLEVRDLRTYFETDTHSVKAVDGVSFRLNRGEIVGIVGESGSGKSMTCLSILRLVPRGARIVGGQIIFDGEDLLEKSEREMRSYRGRRISMVLQDPMTSLNPVFTIGDQVAEPLRLHNKMSRRDSMQKVIQLMEEVKIPSPANLLERYPHQFSGGMRQRAVTAIAISCQPDLLIADEPTTALDVTIQAQVLNLLDEIRTERGLSIILVTHDLGIVAGMCDRVLVMYAGALIERACTVDLFERPHHPYTAGLIRSIPLLGRGRERLYSIRGQPPNLGNLPPGCPFWPRCERVMDVCRTEHPSMTQVGERHDTRCWLYSRDGVIHG
jgi:oligopeptide transport system ATP-binding protein